MDLLTGRRVLCVGAHPDDVELAAWGLLCRSRPAYLRGLMMGGAGTQAEAVCRANFRTLDADADHLGLPFTQMACSGDAVSAIDRRLTDYNIDVIVTHAPQDTHQDHAAVWAMVQAATRRKPVSVVLMHSLSATPEFPGRVMVDVSEAWDRKLRACLSYTWPGAAYLDADWLRAWHTDRYAAAAGMTGPVELYHVERAYL